MLKYLFTMLIIFSTSPLYAEKETLTVYTHASFMSASYGPGLPLKESFEKTCNCEIKYVTLDTIHLAIKRLNF